MSEKEIQKKIVEQSGTIAKAICKGKDVELRKSASGVSVADFQESCGEMSTAKGIISVILVIPYILLLGSMTFSVEFSDGTEICYNGWMI